MASPTLHAVLSPSSSSRWLACTPSARLCERLERRFGESQSPYAAEGTQGHALGELKIRLAIYEADEMTTAKFSHLSAEARQEYPGINSFRYKALRAELGDISDSIERATDSYCDVIMHKYLSAREADPSTRIYLEQRLDISKWVPGSFGSGDCVIVSDSLLEICDLKLGVGVPVSAIGNPQLRLYGLGGLAQFGIFYDFPNIRTTIIQPRLESVTEEALTREELVTWAENEVVDKAQQAWLGTGDFVPGEHCRWCKAKATCSARVAEALKMFQYGLESPGLIPDEQIPAILATLSIAEDWIKDIRAYAENQALHGQKWPGYKLVRGKKPNRKWVDAEEVKAQLLRAGYGPEQFESTALRPVGEIEKTLGKAAFNALLGGLVSQGEGKPTLVPEDDKRFEIASADADFSDIIS